MHRLIEFEKGGYARIGVMPRYGDAESVMWFDVEPCCMFHLINCFEDGDEVHSIIRVVKFFIHVTCILDF
jgi:carotenoid cleavage dioxygenase-like enzyme